MLRVPDDVLLNIFDFYRIDSYGPTGIDSFPSPWIWNSLVHVCRRWRQIIFASVRRLDLQFLCTPKTRVRELLDFLPPTMPIMVWSRYIPQTDLSAPDDDSEEGCQVITALERRDRVQWIHLENLPDTVLEKTVKMMEETFPTLKRLRLLAEYEIGPVLSEEFLGGSAPSLESLWLKGVPFPDVPKLLLTAYALVYLRLEKIPDSGYFSPEAMVTALSTCAELETLVIEFQPGDPDPTSQEITSIARVFLPELTFFSFTGNGGYSNNFITRIESPLGLNDHIRHDTNTSANRVFYEVYISSFGIFFRYHSQLNPVPVED